MKNPEIRFVLSDAAVAELLEGIATKTEKLLASHPDATYSTLTQRRAALGGMLELARQLNAGRLVCALEKHANVLTRQIEAM